SPPWEGGASTTSSNCSIPGMSDATASSSIVPTSSGRLLSSLACASSSSPSVSMIAITSPTCATSLSEKRCSLRIPDTGEGTSESTLSVAISNTGSSSSIESPGCFNHFTTVASDTLSPILGNCRLYIAILNASFPFANQIGTSYINNWLKNKHRNLISIICVVSKLNNVYQVLIRINCVPFQHSSIAKASKVRPSMPVQY